MQKPPTIPGLVFKQRLAISGRGEIWRAVQAKLERSVLAEVIFTKETEVLANILRATADLRHPLFPELVDICIQPWGICILSEDANATPLLQLLKDKHLGLEQLAPIGRGLVDGLSTLQANNLVYANLNPAAIFFSESYEPLLPDRSLIRFAPGAGTNVVDDVLLASPYFAAPEQYLTPEKIDTRADMFALGETIYALGTGFPPFGKLNPIDVLEAKLNQQIPSPCDLTRGFPEALAAVLMRLCEREPEQRYSDWDEVRFDLHQAMEGVAPKISSINSIIAPKSANFSGRKGMTMRLKRPLGHASRPTSSSSTLFIWLLAIGLSVLLSIFLTVLILEFL